MRGKKLWKNVICWSFVCGAFFAGESSLHTVSARTIPIPKSCLVGRASVTPLGKTKSTKNVIKISKTKKKLDVGDSFTIRLKKNKKILSVKWKSTKKSVAKVNKKGVVKALKAGKTTIYAKYKGTKYKCVVTVKTPSKDTSKVKKQTTEENATTEQISEKTIPNETATKEKNNLDYSSLLMDQIKSDKNQLFSPVSLNLALGMVANATEGQVKKDLENFLGYTVEEYNQKAQELMNDLNKRNVVKLANSIWYRNIYSLHPEFEKCVKTNYGAETKSTAMNNDTVSAVNQWAYDNTDGMIPKVIDQVKPDTSAIIANALLFDGQWIEPFQEKATQKEDFTKFDGNKQQVDMMHDHEDNYYENDFATGFEKRYRDGYSFVAILPKKEGDFNLSDLDIKGFLKSNQQTEKVHYVTEIKIPKFEYETSSDLTNSLQNIGLGTIFEKNSVTQMFTNNPAYVDAISQFTKIEMTEKGTKAAAVTTITAVATSIALPDYEVVNKKVYLDRPFAFVIRDNRTEEILFIGKVVCP